MRLPAGEQPIYAVVDSNWSPKDAADGATASRRIALGTVRVQPGMVTVISGRIWR